MKYEATVGDETHEVELSGDSETFVLGGEEKNYEFSHINGRYLLRMGTKLHVIDNVVYEGSSVEFSIDGVWHTVEVKDEQEILLDKLGFKTGGSATEGLLKSPMPGKILDIMVAEGDQVEKGQALAILEAMKMENELKAPVSGLIKAISADVGQSVEKNSPILEIE
ncbi:MAG: biotin/lipoyl-containing protein [Bacteroidota bacterium]